MTDPSPGFIRLEAMCDDAQTENAKRIDARTFAWSNIKAGKTSPGTNFAYCPDAAQRTYRENEARDKAEAERKAAEERAQKR